MNLTLFITTFITVLPKVMPALKELYSLLKKDDPLLNGLSNIKKGVKASTIALLATKEVIEATPTDEDNKKFEKGVEALTQVRDNLNKVLDAIK